MATFILVPDAHTGGWVWHDVAAEIRKSGAAAHPVTLTGMAGEAVPETDLDTHIRDIVRLIDEAQEDVVLVGHGYGIHPALGAAGLRPERVARVVHLDVGVPQDGEPALVPPPVREQLLRDGEDDVRPLPPPAADQWEQWGSTAGLTEETRAQLTRRAAPQPRATLTRPLRSGAAAELPMTGVLCTAGGSSIALVETMVGFGDPALQVLTEPRVTFFELATGHWPMLSAPAELTDVLLQAAEGKGHRIRREQPAHLRPFLLDVPERPRERIGQVDLHLPAAFEHPSPAVVFVHGGPVPPGAQPTPRDWPTYLGYARQVAHLGAVGAVLDHRLHDLGGYPAPAEDVAAAVDLVRADPRVDGDRVALWFFSGGGLLSADWLAAPPPWLRCVAATYPILAPLPGWGLTDARFRPAAAIGGAGRLPVVLTRVGQENPQIAATVEEFLTAARAGGAGVEVVDLPDAPHAFETTDHSAPAREAVHHAVRAVMGHLRG